MKWMTSMSVAWVLFVSVLAGVSMPATAFGKTASSGKVPSSVACAGLGDMQTYHIPAKEYECYYDHGFTGAAASGWNPNLQFAWSRIAAAEVCGIPVSINRLLPLLQKKFGQPGVVNKVAGIGFHKTQIKADPKFCTSKRMRQLKKLMPQFSKGNFPILFANKPG